MQRLLEEAEEPFETDERLEELAEKLQAEYPDHEITLAAVGAVERDTPPSDEHTWELVNNPDLKGRGSRPVPPIDVAASAIGAGAVTPGDGSVSLGTSVFTQTVGSGFPDSENGIGMAFGVDGRWTTAVGSNAGTQSIEWMRTALYETAEYSVLEAEATAAPPGCDGLIYLPYLSPTGERAPFSDPHARAGYVGMVPDHTRAHLVRSVYEGVSLAVRDCLEHLPETPERVSLTGGGARSSFWCAMLADVLGVEVVVPQAAYPAANGAATLLAVGLGLEPDLETAADTFAGDRQTYRPTPSTAETYAELYETFRAIREEMPAVWNTHAEFRGNEEIN